MTMDENRQIEELKNSLPHSPSFRVTLSDDKTTYLNSKVGGSFFWPDSNPPELHFLAQINLSKLPKNDIFPDSGMLQFFLDDSDGCYGLFKENLGQLVFFHGDISSGVEISPRDFPNSPVDKPCGMKFELVEETMSFSDFRFENYVREAGYDSFTDFVKESGCAGDEDILYDTFDGSGCKLLGYPFFTQYDPREQEGDKYDTLLFQLDSDMDHIMWGDCGVANFFISKEALQNMDFSDILFNWDCC